MTEERHELQTVLGETLSVLEQVSGTHRPGLGPRRWADVSSLGNGIALVAGLPG